MLHPVRSVIINVIEERKNHLSIDRHSFTTLQIYLRLPLLTLFREFRILYHILAGRQKFSRDVRLLFSLYAFTRLPTV
jgi:hypothetical protein